MKYLKYFSSIIITLILVTSCSEISNSKILKNEKEPPDFTIGKKVCFIIESNKVSGSSKKCGIIEDIYKIGNTYHRRYFYKINNTYYNLDYISAIESI